MDIDARRKVCKKRLTTDHITMMEMLQEATDRNETLEDELSKLKSSMKNMGQPLDSESISELKEKNALLVERLGDLETRSSNALADCERKYEISQNNGKMINSKCEQYKKEIVVLTKKLENNCNSENVLRSALSDIKLVKAQMHGLKNSLHNDLFETMQTYMQQVSNAQLELIRIKSPAAVVEKARKKPPRIAQEEVEDYENVNDELSQYKAALQDATEALQRKDEQISLLQQEIMVLQQTVQQQEGEVMQKEPQPAPASDVSSGGTILPPLVPRHGHQVSRVTLNDNEQSQQVGKTDPEDDILTEISKLKVENKGLKLEIMRLVDGGGPGKSGGSGTVTRPNRRKDNFQSTSMKSISSTASSNNDITNVNGNSQQRMDITSSKNCNNVISSSSSKSQVGRGGNNKR